MREPNRILFIGSHHKINPHENNTGADDILHRYRFTENESAQNHSPNDRNGLIAVRDRQRDSFENLLPQNRVKEKNQQHTAVA